MKIILVATNSQGKNLVFVTDTLQACSLQEALQLAKEEKIENAYPVSIRSPAETQYFLCSYKDARAY